MDLSPEVLIYIQTVKNYFTTNKEAHDYFIGDSNEEDFFKHLSEISQKNFDKNGEVTLSKEQFELLRVAALATTISKQRVFYSDDKLFMFLDDYPGICMN